MSTHVGTRTRLAAVAALMTLGVVGCAGQGKESASVEATPTTPSAPAAPNHVRAVGLSPEGFPVTYDALGDFFAEVSTYPDAGVLWNGSWRDDVAGGADAGEVPSGARLLAEQAAQEGLVAVPVFGWRHGDTLYVEIPGDATNDWSNLAAADAFVRMTATYAAQYSPPYMFLGNESDAYYEQDPEGYAQWVEVYERAYDAIKVASPDTRVGPVFQYEHLAGAGPNTGWNQPQWRALAAHGGGLDSDALQRVDTLGLTVYPFFAHDEPGDIPDDYLAPVIDRIGATPVFITETGWPAEASPEIPSTWTASPGAQADYVDRFAAFASGVRVEGASWLFLYAPVPSDELGGVDFALFASVSLREASGAARPALESWFGGEGT